MPPFLSQFRSRTNSLLDNITGSIPDVSPNGTFKDNSLTCRKCGNRFRDRLELSSHFNMLPHHSDYSDSHDFASFTRPKVRRSKPSERSVASVSTTAPAEDAVWSPSGGFSASQAYYAVQDKENTESRPGLLRKLPTFSNLNLSAMRSQSMADINNAFDDAKQDEDEDDAPISPTKGKGKQKALPRLPNSFAFGQPLASSDEEGDSGASGPSSRLRRVARSATTQALMSEPPNYSRPRSSISSTASKDTSSTRQAPALPPKLPNFDWQPDQKKPLATWEDAADDTASIHSDASFRTAGSSGMPFEKLQLKMPRNEALEQERGSSGPSSSIAEDSRRTSPSITRNASESNLLLEAVETPHDDAPPSYHELHGDTDPFDDLSVRPRIGSRRSSSRHAPSRSDGWSSVPASPVDRFHLNANHRPRRLTDAWPSSTFPVTFNSTGSSRRNDEDDLYSNASSSSRTRTEKGRAWPQSSKSADAGLPPLVPSSSFTSLPSPSTPKTPFFSDKAPTSPPLSLPRPSTKSSSSAGRRMRQHTRAKSDLAAPSTRCPTCFNKFSSLDKTLEHLDNSDCGAVDFESGIM